MEFWSILTQGCNLCGFRKSMGTFILCAEHLSNCAKTSVFFIIWDRSSSNPDYSLWYRETVLTFFLCAFVRCRRNTKEARDIVADRGDENLPTMKTLKCIISRVLVTWHNWPNELKTQFHRHQGRLVGLRWKPFAYQRAQQTGQLEFCPCSFD